jgi:hypothetical protein
MQKISFTEIDAEIAQRKAAGTIGEFDRLLLLNGISSDEGAAA